MVRSSPLAFALFTGASAQLLPYQSPICPSSFSLSGGRCYKQKFAEPTAICPLGAELEGIDCVTTAATIASCPNNSIFSESGTGCVEKVRAKKIPSCPEGYDLVKRLGLPICQRVVETQPQPYCESSCILHQQQCWETVVTTQPIMQCSVGEVLDNGYCMSEIQSPCESNLRQLGVLENIFNARNCMRTMRRQASMTCGSGLRLLGRTCVRPQPLPLQFRCSGIFHKESRCQHVETAPLEFNCPLGHTEICPAGPFKGRCYCEREVEVLSVAVCPDNYQEVEPGVCAQYFPAALTCPEGYSLDGVQCVQTCYSEAKVVYVPHVQHCTTCEL